MAVFFRSGIQSAARSSVAIELSTLVEVIFGEILNSMGNANGH